jgi:hypothetical protein
MHQENVVAVGDYDVVLYSFDPYPKPSRPLNPFTKKLAQSKRSWFLQFATGDARRILRT